MSTISGIVVVIAFWLAAGIYLWKMLHEGVGLVSVIAVVCFAAGGILRLFVLLRQRGVRGERHDADSARGEDIRPEP